MARHLKVLLIMFIIAGHQAAWSQDTIVRLQPDHLFDGEKMHAQWELWVKEDKIYWVGPKNELPELQANATYITVPLAQQTLLPGFIEGHGHLFLHPYNETKWNDQVLMESRAERSIRAAAHAVATLMAGFTTFRDLGTEGAGYDDVGLKAAIEKGVIPGPRLLIATRAIVATGSYGPKSPSAEYGVPKGAAEADGEEGIVREVRTQIGQGADVIKLYADYRWGPANETRPTFTQNELTAAVQAASNAGRQVAVHAYTNEGIRMAVLAGASTIEHGDLADTKTLQLMKEKGVALFPTLAAGWYNRQYNGWRPGADPEPEAITQKRRSFAEAMKLGVTIGFGGDVGVYAHGNNAAEMELMAEYGMPPMDVLRAATSVNADVFRLEKLVGRLQSGLLADIIAVKGNPAENIKAVREVTLVMKNGERVK